MKRLILFLALAFAVVLFSCIRPKIFSTTVETKVAPWTNLNFNNHPENFQFAIVSDRNGGCRPGVFEDAVRKLNLMQPEFVLSVGDLIAGYTTDTAQITKEWVEVNHTISELKMPFFYLPGNHDITNKVMEREWEKIYGSRYYSFNYKNALFVILDSNDDDDFNLSRKQTDFVLRTLKENDKVRWIFVLMHHPVWTYKTDGRFEEIEDALKGRKYTVIAGHEHHYHHAERNGSNYYILSTTGAGNALRGNYFGEFDHISWITMSDRGPVMANLRLDGILPHDISNEKTDLMARPLIENGLFNNVLLCNRGVYFTNGTLYFSVKNPTKSKLKIDVKFFHHHQLQIKNPVIQLEAPPESHQFIEVQLVSAKPLDYSTIDLLLMDWQFKYEDPDYKEFALNGRSQVEVKPTKPAYIDKEMYLFLDTTTIPFNHPFTNLDTRFSLNDSSYEKYLEPIDLSQTGKLSFFLINDRNEITATESRTFEKVSYLKASEVTDPKVGLEFSYFEGEWSEIPDFTKLESKSKGIATNFMVTEHAKRPDNWGLVYTGYLSVPEDQFYLFRIRADYKCNIYIDNQIVVDDRIPSKGGNHGAIGLNRGFHKFRVEYINVKGDARLRLYSKKAGDEDWISADFGNFFH